MIIQATAKLIISEIGVKPYPYVKNDVLMCWADRDLSEGLNEDQKSKLSRFAPLDFGAWLLRSDLAISKGQLKNLLKSEDIDLDSLSSGKQSTLIALWYFDRSKIESSKGIINGLKDGTHGKVKTAIKKLYSGLSNIDDLMCQYDCDSLLANGPCKNCSDK